MATCVRLQSLCLAAALGLAGASTVNAQSANPYLGSHVRGATVAMNDMIARGAARSSTFKKMIEQLNASDVVVYIEATTKLPSGLDGRLTFMTTAGGVRYLHAQVDGTRPFAELIAVAGHELQHALEVAAHPQVRDATTLAALYEQIGIPSPVKNRYDTVAAQNTGKRVRAELS